MRITQFASRTGERFASWLLDGRRASYGLALMRMTLGGMTVVTLVLFAPNFSYSFGEASRWGQALQLASSVQDFPWPLPFPFDRDDPDLLLSVKVCVLAAVAVAYTLGWRMRIISPLFVYLWLGFSTLNPVITNTGHYQTFRIFIILLLFADLSRRWSLDARRSARRKEEPSSEVLFRVIPWPSWLTNLFNNTAVLLIGVQLCVIYVTSALWKLQGSTWVSGVAVYYPLQVEELTLIPWLNDLVWHVTPVVFIASCASVYLQLLFPLMLLNRWTRMVGLICITGMHAGIGFLLALPFFSALMIAGDMIFIREQSWEKARAFTRARWAMLRRKTRPHGRPEPDPAAEPRTTAAGNERIGNLVRSGGHE